MCMFFCVSGRRAFRCGVKRLSQSVPHFVICQFYHDYELGVGTYKPLTARCGSALLSGMCQIFYPVFPG